MIHTVSHRTSKGGWEDDAAFTSKYDALVYASWISGRQPADRLIRVESAETHIPNVYFMNGEEVVQEPARA